MSQEILPSHSKKQRDNKDISPVNHHKQSTQINKAEILSRAYHN
jgi:hypothetical protein